MTAITLRCAACLVAAALLAVAPTAVLAVPAVRHSYMPSLRDHTRNGILLWSWGRCGTGTFWDTLRETLRVSGMDMSSICDKKEGISYSALRPDHLEE